ncbi:MAG TPA: hypothetical protein VJN18_32020 [Polyangiaceae bacterium]|nr:hypothetical protein [Polyangiaceae bacterium]
MTSALIGASRIEQIEDAVAPLGDFMLSAEELQGIERVLSA